MLQNCILPLFFERIHPTNITRYLPNDLIATFTFFKLYYNKIIVLAETFESKEEIDTKRAEEAIDRAKKRIKKESGETDIDILRAELALKRALNRLKLVR